jgi:hypothetical protein
MEQSQGCCMIVSNKWNDVNSLMCILVVPLLAKSELTQPVLQPGGASAWQKHARAPCAQS